MQIVHATSTGTRPRLRKEFLAPYYDKGDPFASLLARSTYLTKYCRDGEVWTDTILRTVESNAALAPNVEAMELEMLFHLFWTGQTLPPGRSLWVSGIEGIPADARYNCWYTTLHSIDDWCWTTNMLMLGGGVGVGLSGIGDLPVVSANPSRFAVWCRSDHPNIDEVGPEPKSFLNGQTPVLVVEDSRQGWVQALRTTLEAAFAGRDQIVDVSPVRERGALIRTFGGIASGPGPLVQLLRAAWRIVRGAVGRRLMSVECLDVTNHIGLCIKAGNVRRSALIVLGDATDRAFRDAKKDWDAVVSHRHTSNNSIAFRSWGEISRFDWHSLVEDISTYGEPGVLNLPLAWRTDPEATGVNPCFTGDTRIATQFGLVPIKELEAMNKGLRVTTDSRVQPDYQLQGTAGTEVREAIPAFKTSEAEETYRVTTVHGYSLKVTKPHRFPTPDGFVMLQDLSVGDTLLLQSDEGQWGVEGSAELGSVIGWVEGDGNFSGESSVALRFWGDQRHLADRLLPWCRDLADTVPSANGRQYTTSVVQVPDRDSCEITSERLRKALAEVGYRAKGSVPEVIWRGTRECVQGYIQALFATDGQVSWSKGKQCFSIRLSQSNLGLLREVQVLLANFGIVSSTYKRRDAGWRRMPDGKGGMKDYWCEEQFDLCVSKQNAVTFATRIGFMLGTHEAAYRAWQDDWKRGPYIENFTDEIVSIEFVGIEPTYCTTQPSHHTLIAEGVVSGNCGEQVLHDRESCNLSEVFPANFEVGTDPEQAFRLVTRYTLRQRMTPLSDPRSQEVGWRNMRLGVALGGLCDFEWTPRQLATWFGHVRKEADDYANELGVARPITVTTVKPSGTISLLNGSSPGLHAPFAPFYIRRTRIAKNDPMVGAMIGAGVPYEEDVYDKTGHTWVFSFPVKARHTRYTVQTETIRDQFERQAAVQEWWADNAVSATLSYAKSEKDQLANCLEEFIPRLKSTSCLSKTHGYAQAPYETIDEAKYRELSKDINQDHQLVRGGEMDAGGECQGGVCPLR